ncbi:MAG TPA: hypothetical protein PKE39_16465, partial [Ignavibacteria bacterium]|nr:hypothetical protein [Ignavibacteria bacterium]
APDEVILVCLGNDPEKNEKLIRRSARISERFEQKWFTLYVDTPDNSFENIDLKLQRYLINNFKMATEMGGISEKVSAPDVITGIIEFAKEKNITKIVLGKPAKKGYLKKIITTPIVDKLIEAVSKEERDYDIEIIA